MPNIFKVPGEVKEEDRIPKADVFLEYEKSYCQLLKDYSEDIFKTAELLKEIREERCYFYEKKLPLIRAEMENDDVNKEFQQQWLDELQKNMEKSFTISETVVNDFIVDSCEEFKKKLEELLNRIC